ncbi:MAG: DUF4386 domain-containing protein [Bacteroidales bacterium]|nr:DUF4386 domain-containing protein [Bacteroidales bacterium]
MMISISNRRRASLVGVLILLAYSMLTYTITNNIALGVITDIISGLAVIGIPLLLFPIFNTDENKRLNTAYRGSRFIEGILMIIGGVIILDPSLESYREIIYSDIHIYFFIVGVLFFYLLFYRTRLIPRFISIWGIIATIILFIITIIKLFGVDLPLLNALVLPMILNELFLACWLMIKGFNPERIEIKGEHIK